MNYFITDPKILWFLTGLAFLTAEFAIPGLTLLFFGIGAIVTAGCLFILPLTISFQVCLFLVTSMAGLFFFRSKIKTTLVGGTSWFRNAPDPLQPTIVGVEVDVIEGIMPPYPGRVMLHGTSWRASALVALKKGERVRICSRNGLVVTVETV